MKKLFVTCVMAFGLSFLAHAEEATTVTAGAQPTTAAPSASTDGTVPATATDANAAAATDPTLQPKQASVAE